ncbi:TetR/AcrR family transcriptional regulator [Egicoccus sp. AB-alg2]|uniref:TetR/AcrR family transcriptional regulator n=1 Tax=Egicoccus sp. AB-alg2 TaxID=3242693 RepID=UPI00359DD607
MPRPSARLRLLKCAAEVVRRDGAGALTLDAVAEEAGASKGGVLYHFPTKAALVKALVDDVLDTFESEVDSRAAHDPRAGAWAHAYVDATFDVAVSQPDLAVALLFVTGPDGSLLHQCAARLDAWHRTLLADGLSPATGALVRYACDGWWTVGTLGAGEDREVTAALRQRLHAMIDDEVGP